MESKFKKYYPIIFFELYLNIVLLLFVYGPWEWPITNNKVIWIIIAYNIFLFIGYIVGYKMKFISIKKKINYKKLYLICTIITTILIIPTSISRTGSILPNITNILSDIGSYYFETMKYRSNSSRLVEYIRIILSPILVMYIPMTVYYWKKLNIGYKIIGIINIGYTALISMGQGQNKGVFDVFIIFLILIPIIIFNKNIKIRVTKKFKRLICIIVLGLIAFSFFSSNIESRTDKSIYNSRARIYANMENPLVNVLPDSMQYGFIQLCSYVTQGYYGMSLALELDFIPMYGVGGSRVILENTMELLNNYNLESYTYPARTKMFGWDPDAVWSSAYSWWASDISFWGIPIILIILGILIAKTWKSVIINKNIFSIVFMTQLTIIVLYLPANNQMFQNPESFFGFMILTIIWGLNSKYKMEE